ncbi:RNA polymerase sigma factor [Cyclobacterium marinum]|uniref:RNA polymerase, sigma-24 subunit, ECF subfamily n=1 Tax=Cyclobacterium marinum (strain ATCC 25205 / DSM 745 / LMG 13164 / NCIMB 1802) TaxID=880070 RepID=G0J8A8_CYCMS|nr:sigma-70 family RNA polymerase sigma factor [Cyclobacterium marinum]AEL28708.1 RNA polymerase, sigma-24 subunit, ECF subfamily [Cyclobacterium marinum DSM 745]MBI0398547.1 sigma-70 family RNA polymerase sigma factor [Cyclobacterium marinum]
MPEPKISISSKRLLSSISLEEAKVSHSTEMMNDEQLISHALKEDPKKGMGMIFQRYYQPLCSHAVRFVGSKEVAQDLVSDLLVHFYDQKLYLKVNTSIRSYLFQSVRNRGYNYLKHDLARKGELSLATEPRIPETYEPDSITEYEELYQDFEKAIETLPGQRRKIYLLFQFEGKTMKEISTEIGLSIRTVETQLYRSKITIRQLLRDKWLLWLITFTQLFN